MIEKILTIQNKLGVHARAAAKLVDTAGQFLCRITIKKGTKEINAKSIMAVMMLAASKGTELTVITDGNDEKSAMNAIEKLINNKFGEEE